MPETQAVRWQGAAREWADREFSGPCLPVESRPSVGVAAVEAAPNDSEAVSILVINTGSTQITLGFAPDVTSGNGIILLASGGMFSANVRDDGLVPSWSIWAISASAGGTLYVLRIRRDTRTRIPA